MHFRPIRQAFGRNMGVVVSALVTTSYVVSFWVAAGTFPGATIRWGSVPAPGLLAVAAGADPPRLWPQ